MGAGDRIPSFCASTEVLEQTTSLIAGVEIPPEGVTQRGEVTVFRIDVTPANGGPPWEVWKRYQQFHDLYVGLHPVGNHLAAVAFPRKHLLACTGRKLEARRQGLEAWLMEVVREAQSREPQWFRPLCVFLNVL